MRLIGFTFAVLFVLAGAGQAMAASQPDHRPPGQIIWFQPSQVIVDGTTLIETGETDKVIEGMTVIRREMQRDLEFADMVSARNNLCVGHLLLKQFHEALDECSGVIKMKPALWQGYNNRANANMGLGNYTAAIPDYEKAAELNPESNTVQGNLDLARRQLAN
jgi:tetratricopeptide (TPR) repeat protein